MKRMYKQVILITGLLLAFGLPAYKSYAQDDAYVSYNDFYQNLAPYGQWIQDPQYGYVWSPNVDESFRPYYTNGNWVMTNYGNTWVSTYPWGWACFHYGRWTYDAYYGWLWIPGSDWGPAWVSWRYGEGNYGWAPLGPGYDLSSSYDYTCPNDWWVFIPPQYMYSGNYYRYWYGPRGNSEIINNTQMVRNNYVSNNVTYVAGPRSSEITQITHQPVQVYNLASSSNLNTRIHDNTVKMYRPAQIRPAAPNGNGERTAPPNAIAATQPIASKPQPVNVTQGNTPAFKSNGPRNNTQPDAIGTNPVEAQRPSAASQRADNHAYQWDVNKSMPQPQTRDVPEYHGQQPSAPQPESRPQQLPPERSQPQPQPRQQQPMQQPREAPMPQQAPRPAPAAPQMRR